MYSLLPSLRRIVYQIQKGCQLISENKYPLFLIVYNISIISMCKEV